MRRALKSVLCGLAPAACSLAPITGIGSGLGTGIGIGAGLALTPGVAVAQFGEESVETLRLKRQTLMRMMKPVTVDLQDHRLEDVAQFIADVTQADITPLWIDDRNISGLDPDTTVTLSVKNVTALDFLEMVLDKIGTDVSIGEGATWQFTKYGGFEFGPKELLNKRRRVEIYDINDMLMDVPDYDNAPEFDLNTVFQQGGQQGAGGGGQSPFQDQGTDVDRRTYQEKVDDVTDLLTLTVEPEQWLDNGGEAATIRELRGNLFINAPDYIHRQIAGYSWWPSRQQSVKYVNDRRYVSLDGTYDFAETGLDTAIDIDAVP